MNAPSSTLLSELCRSRFCSSAVQLPQRWQDSPDQTAAQQLEVAIRGISPLPSPHGTQALFASASSRAPHKNTATQLSRVIGDYLDGVCSALSRAWDTWQKGLSGSGIAVAGPMASGGTFCGPLLEPLILAAAPQDTATQLRYSRTIAAVVGAAWLAWEKSLKLPGLPLFPALTAVPAPVVPPTPGLPTPLLSLTQITTPLSARALKQQLVTTLGDPSANLHGEIFDAVAYALEQSFVAWQAATVLTNLTASGVVPTFAPPAVPAGPILGTAQLFPGSLL